jgi:hypothetical protein
VKTKHTIELTPEEVEEILRQHFGVKDAKVEFVVGMRDPEGDWQAALPPEHPVFEGVELTWTTKGTETGPKKVKLGPIKTEDGREIL